MINFAEEGSKSSSGQAYRAPSRRLTLRPGKYVLWAEHGSEREYRSENVTVECIVGKPRGVELQLRAVPAVFGTVTVPAVFAAAHVNVYLAPIGEGEPDDGDYHGHGRSGVLDPSTHPRKYRIADIEPGAYRVLARTPSGDEVSQRVEVASGPVRVDLVLPDPRREDYIVIRAFDPAGEAVTDLQSALTVNRRAPAEARRRRAAGTPARG
jgi:hypothetical protein